MPTPSGPGMGRDPGSSRGEPPDPDRCRFPASPARWRRARRAPRPRPGRLGGPTREPPVRPPRLPRLVSMARLTSPRQGRSRHGCRRSAEVHLLVPSPAGQGDDPLRHRCVFLRVEPGPVDTGLQPDRSSTAPEAVHRGHRPFDERTRQVAEQLDQRETGRQRSASRKPGLSPGGAGHRHPHRESTPRPIAAKSGCSPEPVPRVASACRLAPPPLGHSQPERSGRVIVRFLVLPGQVHDAR